MIWNIYKKIKKINRGPCKNAYKSIMEDKPRSPRGESSTTQYVSLCADFGCRNHLLDTIDTIAKIVKVVIDIYK